MPNISASFEINTEFNNIVSSSIKVDKSMQNSFASPVYYDKEIIGPMLFSTDSILDIRLTTVTTESVLMVLSPDLEILAYLEDYEDFVWNRRWRRVDDFEVSLPVESNISKHLIINNYIAKKNGGVVHAGRIKRRKMEKSSNGEYITVGGQGLGEIFEDRIAFNNVKTGNGYDEFSGSAESAMKHYVDNNVSNPDTAERKVDRLKVSTDNGRGVDIEYRARFQKISEILYEISQTTGLGWDLTLDLDNKKFVFKTLSAKIKKGIRLNPKFDSVKMISFEEDKSEQESTILIAGQGQAQDRTILSVDRNEV